jgi:hypothetical protein
MNNLQTFPKITFSKQLVLQILHEFGWVMKVPQKYKEPLERALINNPHKYSLEQKQNSRFIE